MDFTFDAFVTGIAQDCGLAAFGLGDGTVRWESGVVVEAHDGAILCLAAHPSGEGVITGGDDGRLVWSRPQGPKVLAEIRTGWIDTLAVSSASGLIAYASGKVATVISATETGFSRRFEHPASVSDLAFDPKGRRLAAATYGGVALWYARIADQKPVMLKWAGPHAKARFSPDGRFVVSALQEPALHIWRLSDGQDGQMAGPYGAKARGLAFVQGGDWLTSTGSDKSVLWPMMGKDGPLGKPPAQMSLAEKGLIVAVAGRGDDLIVGLENGKILAIDLDSERQVRLKTSTGAPISALEILSGRRVAWGDEAGVAGLFDLS
jgi:WD40 repeat protein